MATTIGLPSLTITFQAAAQQAANRSKKGYVGVFVRDAKAQGVHQLSSAALIPTELGQENQNYIRRAFTGSDRGGPSKVVAVVIATGTEDTTALEAGLKSIEGLTLDYLAGPPDATAAELTALEKWVKDRRAAYFTEKLVEPNAAKAPDDMGIIDFAETDGAIAEGAATYTAGQYASRIAGVLAGIPAGMSATYAPLMELTAVTPRSTQEQEAAIKAGKLILIHDGVKAKIARGVNSLTTIPATGKADWSKIKIVEGMDTPHLLSAHHHPGRVCGPVRQHLRQQVRPGDRHPDLPGRAGGPGGALLRGELGGARHGGPGEVDALPGH